MIFFKNSVYFFIFLIIKHVFFGFLCSEEHEIVLKNNCQLGYSIFMGK